MLTILSENFNEIVILHTSVAFILYNIHIFRHFFIFFLPSLKRRKKIILKNDARGQISELYRRQKDTVGTVGTYHSSKIFRNFLEKSKKCRLCLPKKIEN